MQKIETNPYLESVLEATPRLLTQLNRNPLAHTYGSFDRAYWHFRTNMTQSARYQEATLTLALLYVHDFEGNIYHHNNQILEWINASLTYTASIQRADGSFDEWYPYEGSYVATAFVSAALAETVRIISKEKISNYASIETMLKKSGAWLLHHTENSAWNQLAGGMLALERIGQLFGEQKFKTGAYTQATRIKNYQSKEGWWPEYGGPDIGYLSLMIDYLAKYIESSTDTRLLPELTRSTTFITYFLHPNFTTGGEYGSRNTEYLIPSGFSILAPNDQNASLVASFIETSLLQNIGIHPKTLDDRYLCYILYNWLEAGLHHQAPNQTIAEYIQNRRFDIFFPESGIRALQNNAYYFVTNLKKGGPFRLYTKHNIYIDSGIECTVNELRLTSNTINIGYATKQDTTTLEVSGYLKHAQMRPLGTLSGISLIIFQYTFGRLPWMQKLIKKIFRSLLITSPKKSTVPFRRTITLHEDFITTQDVIEASIPLKKPIVGKKTSYALIPSAQYFTPQDITPTHEHAITHEHSRTIIKRHLA
ncbi:MAG: hypothetical protein AAB372_00875 [Patescibacteria group bacterium]